MRSLSTILVASFAAAFAPNAARADDPLQAPRYKLQQESPGTGTNIPADVVTGSAIPLNRRYNEMSADEKRSVKALYETMAEADEPPFPADGLAPVYRSIQRVIQALQVKGVMTLVVDVDASGEATAVRVTRSDDPELTRTVAQILMLTKYKPGICAGKPCAMAFPFRIAAEIRH